MIRIVPPPADGNKAQSAIGTMIFTESGDEIKGVTAAEVRFAVDEFITAKVTVCAHMEEVWALPFMSEDSFLAAADRYGYEVTKKESNNAETDQ